MQIQMPTEELTELTREQKLNAYIEGVREAREITPETAVCAWDTWKLLSEATQGALSVPDASYGPEGQFLFIWDKEEHHLELEIEPDGSAYLFYRNRNCGALWDSNYKVGDVLTPEMIEKLRIVA